MCEDSPALKELLMLLQTENDHTLRFRALVILYLVLPEPREALFKGQVASGKAFQRREGCGRGEGDTREVREGEDD